MKVRFRKALAGTDPETGRPVSFRKGQEADLSGEWVEGLAAGGIVEKLAKPKPKSSSKRTAAAKRETRSED